MSHIPELFRTMNVPATSPATEPRPLGKTGAVKPGEFAEVLKKESLSFSQHAETRIKSRDIPWSPELEKRVTQGLEAASKKGSRETLILADDIALIANVKSKTIITAMNRDQLKEKVFTNIDSAVLV